MKKIRFLLVTLVALLAGVNSVAAKTVYIQPNAWAADNAVISLWVWAEGSDGSWATLSTVEDGVYKAELGDAINRMIITRGSAGNTFEKSAGFWNQTGTIEITDANVGKLFALSTTGVEDGTTDVTVSDYTEPVAAGYTFNFNNNISTSNRDFAVASNWGHIVDYDSYYDNHMSYSYSATTGVDGSGALLGYGQLDYDWGQQSSGRTTYDLIVTPLVSGEVTLAVKLYNTTGSVKFYKVSEVGGVLTRGDEIDPTYSDTPSQSAYVTATINVDVESRIGIRVNYAYIDNFTAENATIIPEKAITISSAAPTATTGTIYWNQQANGKVLVKYTVTVTNTGDVALTQGTDGYSVSIFNRTTNDVYCTVPVPQDLAVGATSDPFDVEAELETSIWPNTYTYYSMDLRENLKSTVVQRAQSGYKAYQSTFVFRADGSTSTSSISSAESWGTITASTTKSFEIYNGGLAPLTINSITLPDGFTSADVPAIPAAGLEIAGNDKVTFSITQDATTQGAFTGTLTIAYQNYGSSTSTNYTLNFSATVIGANTWTADFNGDGTKSTITYPAGSIAEGGINNYYTYNSGKYDFYLMGRTSNSYASENNKFITPKLHANAGDKLTYDVKGNYSSNNTYYAKVYVSTDRKNWGDPVAYYTYSAKDGAEAISSANWYNRTLEFTEAGDYYVAFALYGEFKIDNVVGLEKADVAHDIYIKSVSWPDASIKSGASQTKPSVDIIPLTDETAESYTVKYMYGETVLAVGTPVAMTASANSTKTFSFSWAPSVENTTTYNGTKVVFEFTDGTKFETETFDLTVTNEPIFHFLNSVPSSKWYEPTDRTAPITFGKTNTADTQSFIIYNWGSAPLTVNSISLPEGFTTTTEFPFTVAAFDESDLSVASKALDITFSATAAGTYSGDMVITYSGDQTFTLPISGTKLDPTKWYANFNDEAWPAGSVYQDNVSISFINTGDYGLMSSSSTKNLFITPKLTAVAGDVLQFDASTRNNYYDGTVKVFIGTDRENFGDAVKEIALSKTDNVSKATYEYTFATAGDYYVAFALEEARVDELYGLKLAEVAHDLAIASSNIPTEGMQNYSSTATVNVQNFGVATDKVTVTAYIKNVAVATSAETEVAMNHRLTDAGTQVSVSYMSNVKGTFPVYLEVKAGDYSVKTDPVDVVFAEEVAMSDAIEIGSGTTTSYNYAPIDFYNFESARTSDILYTQAQLTKFGLKSGDKITTLAFKGTATSAKTISKSSLKAWVALSSGDITYGSPDKTAMTEIAVYNAGEMAFVAGANMITINLPDAITYDGTSDLRIYLEGGGNGEWVSLNFAYDTDYSNMKWSNSTNKKYNPLLYVTLAAQSATLAGNVLDSNGAAISGATITLKADNGVQYSTTTNDAGQYTLEVIQAGLSFTATVEADGYLKRQFALNMGGTALTQDVTMYKQFGIVGSLPGLDWDNDLVMIQDAENPNIFVAELNNIGANAGEYKYKLRADGEWKANLADGYELPDPGDFEWEIKTTGVYNYKFTFDWTNHTLTFERPYTLAENATGVDELNWVDVTIEREFKAGWNAVVLPFSLNNDEFVAAFGANSEVAISDGDHDFGSGNVTVFFKKQDDTYKWIDAGVPYLIWLENPVSGLKFTKDIVTNTSYTPGQNFDFVGVYTTTQTQDGDYFVKNGEFQKCNTTNTVKPFRAYLKYKGTSPVRSLNFVVDDETITTEIDGLEIDTPVKVEGAYNLNGQKVENLKKGGLYIINGKKVIWK